MTDWVQVFDQSFQRVTSPSLAYQAGYRVMAGYAGGGSSGKWLPRREIDAWFALGDDTGISALFEIAGTEPITNPSSGATHAREARAAWQALGYPDDCAISPAVDQNVTMTQARDQLAQYFRAWRSADTCAPIPYVEADAGAYLHSLGITAGTFTPAAYGWNSPAVLYTPDNAPDHVVWTQEHNGVRLAGGSVDIGHIRTSTPIWWRTDMPLSDTDIAKVAAAVWNSKAVDLITPPPGAATTDNPLWRPAGTLSHINAVLATLADPATLAKAIAAEIPGMTEAQMQTAVTSALSKLTLVATPASPAP